LSGSGPSILVFYEENSESVLELVRGEFGRSGQSSEVVAHGIDEEGLQIT
jgi:homoserine kinase